MRRGFTPLLARLLKRRSTIKPEIGHVKMGGRLARCPLKGRIGDAVFAVLCPCGHNIRKILAHLKAFWSLLLQLAAVSPWLPHLATIPAWKVVQAGLFYRIYFYVYLVARDAPGTTRGRACRRPRLTTARA